MTNLDDVVDCIQCALSGVEGYTSVKDIYPISNRKFEVLVAFENFRWNAVTTGAITEVAINGQKINDLIPADWTLEKTSVTRGNLPGEVVAVVFKFIQKATTPTQE